MSELSIALQVRYDNQNLHVYILFLASLCLCIFRRERSLRIRCKSYRTAQIEHQNQQWSYHRYILIIYSIWLFLLPMYHTSATQFFNVFNCYCLGPFSGRSAMGRSMDHSSRGPMLDFEQIMVMSRFLVKYRRVSILSMNLSFSLLRTQ